MNVYDSGRMADVMVPHGYTQVDAPEDADMVLLNTCHIREKASEKVFSELGRLKALKEKKAQDGGKMVIGVAGCVAQAEGVEIMKRQPAVDVVVGPQAYHHLPDLVKKAAKGKRRALDTDFPVDDKFAHLPPPRRHLSPTAFLSVQEGCDKFCAFCVVPYTRGAEYSRSVDAVMGEAQALVDGGVREITLLGQNVNAYHGAGPVAGGETGDYSLAALIKHLAKVDGLERIRYTTSHPRDMSDDLIGAHGDVEKLMPYLHLPVQSGSDAILAAMNRQHTAQAYVDIIEKVRAARRDIALSSDFIVGFPGETDVDFEATLDLVHEVTFAQAYSFKFSARPGTPAAGLSDQIPEEVKSERLARLQEILGAQQSDFNKACVGRSMPVLFEKPGRQDGQVIGRSPYLQSVHIGEKTPEIGQIVNVAILEAKANSLSGIVDA